MSVELRSTKAKVRDRQKVSEILDSYAVDGVEIELSEEDAGSTLEMTFNLADQDEWELPTALHRSLWPREEPGPYEDELETLDETEWDRLCGEKGCEGFLALLGELAPYLETPLQILVAVWDEAGGSATTWRVQPGAREVEKLDVYL